MRPLSLLLQQGLRWRPWNARRRAARLAQHRALAMAFDQHMQEAKAYQTREKKAAPVDWDALDAPWVALLEAWLADIDHPEGLDDLLSYYATAWHSTVGVTGHPAMTPVSRWVTEQLNRRGSLPVQAMRMALESSRQFCEVMWTWALTDAPDHSRIPLAMASHRTYASPGEWRRAAVVIALTVPQSNAALFDELWTNLSNSERVDVLSSWVTGFERYAEWWVRQAASAPLSIDTNCLQAWVPDAWHQGLLNTIQKGVEGHFEIPQVLRWIGEWGRHWPGSHKGCLKQELCHLWDRALWFRSPARGADRSFVEVFEGQMAARLDQMTPALAPMVPLAWWTDPNFWGARAALPLTLSAARQLSAQQRPPEEVERPRTRRRS